ncbi:hypothetical protein [Sphingobium sp. Z007]|uniref:hypothetical protein n=1 Tax=Sphingobium sp. Z007 TaxID=627495 RepID=UPI000B49C9CC|nr:hypothetical protein [Sphingobium sp. Z007]
MTTFSIVTDADDTCALCATVRPDHLDGFLVLLRTEARHLNAPLLDCDGDLDGMLSDGFEARVCPFPLDHLARIFEHDPAVITRKVTIWRQSPGRTNPAPHPGGDRSSVLE